jgi:hypothetical protein
VAEPVQVPPEHVREPRPRSRRTELERLIDLTVLGSTHPELGTCWLFTGTTTPYGRIAKAQDSYTHRLGWKLLRGPIPEGGELHHQCGVYACWNPDHLQLVTHAENLAFKRKTHCKHGHPLSGENVRIDPRTGARVCRACLRENQRRLRATVGRTKTSDPSSSRQASKSGRPPGRRRSVFERLVARTVLGRCHPELGTCWVFTGPTDPYGRIGKAPSGSSTAWAGFSYAARYPTAWSFTIGVASMPAGIPTICSWSLTPRIWRTAARRTASVDTRCRVPTYGSTQGLERGSAVSAARSTSERFANA